MMAADVSSAIYESELPAEGQEEKCSSPTEEDEAGSSDEEEDSEESEEVEPRLKYKRLLNDLTSILSRDASSCLAVHTKFLALGTHWGMIYILDHCGNNIISREIPAHTTTVNQICIDDNGDYIASCSDDGRVVINGFYNTDNNHVIHLDRPIKAVAMDPEFYKPGSGRQFVTGDDKLIMNEKGFLSRHKSYTIHQGEGPIYSVKWKSSFIAWANDLGVKVYDMNAKRRITFIPRDKPNLRPELYRCSLCWKDERTLLIGWADSVKICVVKERGKNDVRDLPNRYVEITAMFSTDFMVCGIAPYQENIVVLTYDEAPTQTTEGGEERVASRPHLRILEAGINFCEELSNDALSIRGFQEYRCNDYHLECLIEDNLYFIVSPKDIVEARQRNQDDHISWLLEHQMFAEALSTAMTHSKELKKHDYQEIGRQYLTFLLEEESYEDAAGLCVKILGRSKTMWEEEVFRFAQIGQLKAIATFLPRSDPRLSPTIYEMVLNEYLQTDHAGFQQLINDWPSDLYNIQTLVNAVLDQMDRHRHSATLMQCLGELYTHERRYDLALGIYLKLKHKDVFALIHKHNLFDAIDDKIRMLVEFDTESAVKMLLDNIEKIPVEKVVDQLEETPMLLHEYLHRLFRRHPHSGQEFHALQVRLYAEFDRPQLLPFLRASNYYPLQGALQVCEERELIPEMIFLLVRMGDMKQSLHLITNDLQDVDCAIRFCKEHNDAELWDDLVNFSIDKPNFITGLLQNIGTHVDPIILIQKIREGMFIPGLRDSLVKILHDYNLQMSLREGCQKILVADCFSLMQKLVTQQRSGVCIDEYQVCQACHERIITRDLRTTSNTVVFYCHHTFHEDCLPSHSLDACTICSAQRRRPGSLASPR